MTITLHMLAFVSGFLLDCLFGDPYWMPHPVRFMGNLISFLDKKLMGEKHKGEEKKADAQNGTGIKDDAIIRSERRKGILLVICVLAATAIVSEIIFLGAYAIHPIAGFVVEAIMTYQILAARCLQKESTKVYTALKKNDLLGARYAVSMIVGRDTNVLDEAGVARAAVETVAESTSDGVIAPMLYTALGGPVLGMIYKAVNTMDSMVGYKSSRYLYFGRAAAKLDDVINWVPARISALLLIAGSAFLSVTRIFSKEKQYIILKMHGISGEEMQKSMRVQMPDIQNLHAQAHLAFVWQVTPFMAVKSLKSHISVMIKGQFCQRISAGAII